MLEAGHVKAGDVVYDLGSGDGRIVIMAAQKFGARAWGSRSARTCAGKPESASRRWGWKTGCAIVEDSALRVDLSPATVVTMYLLTSSNERMRPSLEKYLKPGARVVSNDYPISGWKPAECSSCAPARPSIASSSTRSAAPGRRPDLRDRTYFDFWAVSTMLRAM